jgi:hypothetical protein
MFRTILFLVAVLFVNVVVVVAQDDDVIRVNTISSYSTLPSRQSRTVCERLESV